MRSALKQSRKFTLPESRYAETEKTQTLLIIGAGVMQVPAIKIARAMGLRTVVTDYNPHAPGMTLADIPVVMSTRDVQGTIRIARETHAKYPIRGCLTVGTDASVTVAAVCEALGLPGIRTDAAERATDKIKMRSAFLSAGVPSPKFCGVWTLSEAEMALADIGLPAVIKPADNMGARGVKKISKEWELETAFREAKAASTSGGVILEEFMPGDELSIDVLIFDGRPVFSVVADRIIRHPPYFVEIGHILPSAKPPDQQDAAVALTVQGCRALGITQGAAKSDIKLTPAGPKIGELAARLSGGFMSGYTCPAATGVEIIRAAIEIALGRTPSDLRPTLQQVSVERSIIPPPGRVLSVGGQEEVRRMPGVVELFVDVKEGDLISPPKSNLDKAGHVIVVGPDRESALRLAEEALARIQIEIGAPTVLGWDEIRTAARARFGAVCTACKECDGKACAGQVPGVGGVGTGETFMDNFRAWRQLRLELRTIHEVKEVHSEIELFGLTLRHPILAAPMTGTSTNMGGVLTEEEFTDYFIRGMADTGCIPMVGDGASINKYQIILDVAARYDGWAIPIFKPRADEEELRKRFDLAREVGCPAVGMDIDAANFITMQKKGVAVEAKTPDQLRDYIRYSGRPFILKGIMTPDQAELAMKVGASAIVVSNHGGRVLDHMPSTASVLPGIASHVKTLKGQNARRSMKIFVDGGIRTGDDALKALALGADAVLVGRPLMIAAVGGKAEGVSLYVRRMEKELRKAMLLTGCANIGAASGKILHTNC
ncbi:alpha-hydroxy-acid oxidizing protein [bacterium]|nr:alpha-hydroxy-acid oxidizing protein [bacterium]